MQALCKKHNRHKPLEDWEEHLHWLTVKASKKAKIEVVELE